ncbi:MAG TPA: hypothetical protein VIV60_19990 [Polyangiaceae bacterium]
MPREWSVEVVLALGSFEESLPNVCRFTSSPSSQRIDADYDARQAADVQLKLAKQATAAAGDKVTEKKAAGASASCAALVQL